MNGYPYFTATTTQTVQTSSCPGVSDQRGRGGGSWGGGEGVAGVAGVAGAAITRLPASKKVKLESTDQPLQSHNFGLDSRRVCYDFETRGIVDEKGVQTESDAFIENGLASRIRSPSAATEPLTLDKLRQTISEQFDVEIVLKHREIRLIEQEMAKTQIAIEQLRRVNLLPYSNSAEAQLSRLSPESVPYGIPPHAPPPGVVDGPYTRHYRQWLIPHRDFDGASVEPFAQPALPVPVVPGLQQGLSMVGNGRPQRASAMKVQTKTGEQVCIFRKKDGSVVKLTCNTCHRSNFSSAQGFINHCRIAHQTEFPSHDAAAEACGQPIDADEESLISPLQRTSLDGPARHTRQTQAQTPVQLHQPLTPILTAPRRNSTTKAVSGYINPYILNPNYNTTKVTLNPSGPGPAEKPSHAPKRKSGGSRRTSTGNPKLSKAKGPQQMLKGSGRPPTPPQDFNTPHLEGLLKRKRLDINVKEMVKDVTENRVDWENIPIEYPSDDESGPVTGLKAGSTNPVLGSIRAAAPTSRYVAPSSTPLGTGPPTPNSQEPPNMRGMTGFSSTEPTPSRRPLSGLAVSSDVSKKRTGSTTDEDIEMIDTYDASSSSDEEGGYRSDGDGNDNDDGNDDDLYSVPPTTQPIESLAYQGPGSNGTINPMMLHMPTTASTSHTSGFFLSSTPSSMAHPPTPRSEQPSADLFGAISCGVAMVNMPKDELPPKHVRFAVSGIGGDLREGVNGTSG